jgi:hypothetical protein
LFQNVSAHACTLRGYPGLDALTAHHTVLAHAARHLSGFGGTWTISTVTLRPLHWSSSLVDWTSFNPATGGACRYSAAIAVTPPNTTRTVYRDRSVSVCGLQVHPVVAGTSALP